VTRRGSRSPAECSRGCGRSCRPVTRTTCSARTTRCSDRSVVLSLPVRKDRPHAALRPELLGCQDSWRGPGDRGPALPRSGTMETADILARRSSHYRRSAESLGLQAGDECGPPFGGGPCRRRGSPERGARAWNLRWCGAAVRHTP
jgi:hypothetical protein